MADDAPAPSSIADRIAALKLNQVGRTPENQMSTSVVVRSEGNVNRPVNGQRRQPPPPPARPELPARPDRTKSINNPPLQDYGSAVARPVLNRPEQGDARPPLPSRPSVSSTTSSVGPALPPRRTSEQTTPALPPRRPSDAPSHMTELGRSRRGSNESVSSVATGRSSLSGTSNATSLNSFGDVNRMRAPAYDPASLPKLPPNRTKEEKEADARKYAGLRPLRQVKSAPKVEPLGKESTPPPMPTRPTRAPAVGFPSRNSVMQDQRLAIESAPAPPARPAMAVPPPARPRQSALAFGMNKVTESAPALASIRPNSVPPTSGLPPPIPVLSKPNLAALQASKPNVNGVGVHDNANAGSQSVMELTPSNFDQIVLRSGKPTFVDFYLPWCVPCKDFAPTYEEVARSHGRDRVTIARYDHGTHKAIGDRYGVNCWPTLLWFDGKTDNPIDYRPLRRGWEKEDLTDFILENTEANTEPAAVQPFISNAGGDCWLCRDWSGPDDHAARFPRESLPSYDVGWLAQQLTAPFPLLTDKARAIFTWCHHNIAYDTVAFFNKAIKPSTPQGTIASGLAVCEGYAGLYCAIALKAGLECMVISGASKGFGHTQLPPGAPVPPFEMTHAWNAVRLEGGRWQLIDACWGAGNVSAADHSYTKKFDPHWFTDTNEDFGRSHYPTDRALQFLPGGRIVPWEEYVRGSKEDTQAQVYSGHFTEEGMSKKSLLPNAASISLSQQPGPTVRFAFQKKCPHWDPRRHGNGPHYLYVLFVEHLKDSGRPHMFAMHTNGEVWWYDVPVRDLGPPGETVVINIFKQFDGKDGRHLTEEHFNRRRGKCGWAGGGVCKWDIVA